MNRVRVLLTIIVIIVSASGYAAFKVNRNLNTFWMVDSTNPNPAARLCTKQTQIFYTTNPLNAIPGAIGIIQTTYFTAPVNATTCRQATLFSAE